MIGYLKGIIKYFDKNYIVVLVNGVGYRVEVPSNLVELIGTDAEVELYIYPEVSERSSRLFGFLDKETLDLFELLITVNGVGPKAALNILSRASLKDLMSAINESDVNFLSSLPSLGKKTAEKIILDLKGKISLDINIGNWSEVRSALVNLGYSNIEVDSIYSVFKEKYGDSTDLSNSVRMAISLLKGDKKNYE